MLSLKIRHQRNRPLLLNVLGTILYRNIKVNSFGPRSQNWGTQLWPSYSVFKPSRILAYQWDQIQELVHDPLWPGLCNSFWPSFIWHPFTKSAYESNRAVCLYHPRFPPSTYPVVLFSLHLDHFHLFKIASPFLTSKQCTHDLAPMISYSTHAFLTPRPFLLGLF